MFWTNKIDVSQQGCVRTESSRELKITMQPKALNQQEKKFLLAVERGDLATVKRYHTTSWKKKKST